MAALKGIYKLIGIFYIILASDSFGTVPSKGATVSVSPATPSPAPPSVKSPPVVASPKLPEFSHASHGSISATTAVDGKSMTIKTGPSRNVGDFHSYNIARGHTVNVSQQSAGSKSVFRVGGDHPANIWGTMKVNQGDVFLTGPGFIFHEGSTINASNLVVAAAHFSDASARNFANGGNLLFDVIPGGGIFSKGSIQIDDGGILGFIGANITEDGLIKGKKIQVNGIAGEKVWVEFDDNLINFRADGVLDDASIDVSKSARIETKGGDVNLTLSGMDKVLRNSINVEGYVDAGGSSIDDAGNIVFDAGKGAIKINGKVQTKATGKDKSTAGDIKVKAKKIDIGDTAVLDASGDYAAGRIEVGGTRLVIKDSQGPKGKPIAYADDVTISEGAILLAQRNKGGGKAGQIFAVAKNYMDFKGTANVEAWGKGNGGFIELSQLTGDFSLSSIKLDQVLFKNHGTGTAGQFLIDPARLTVDPPGGTGILASTLETWLGLGTVFIETTEFINITGAVNINSKYDLVLISQDIYINNSITLNDYGNLILWLISDSSTIATSAGGSINSNTAGRNFIALSRPTSSGPTFDSVPSSSNISKFIFNRNATGGDAVELGSGTHYTANVTNATLPGSLASRNSFNIIGLKDGSTVTEVRSSGLVDGTKVGVLDRVSIGIADTNPLIDVLSESSLIAYTDMTMGDISGEGSIADVVNADKNLFLKGLKHTVNSVTGSSGTGGVVGENKGHIRSINTKYGVGAVSGADSTGGIIGKSSSGNIEFIDDTTVTVASVTSTGNSAGGLVGNITGSDLTLTGATTLTVGNITLSGSSKQGVGGLVGLMGDNSNFSIDAATTINSIGNISGGSYAGGLVGKIFDSAGTTSFIIRNPLTITSIGTIGDSSSSNIGGLIGYSDATTVALPGLTISTIGAITGTSYVGGLIGYAKGAGNTVSISDTKITTITSVTGTDGNINNVAGLVGLMDNDSTTLSKLTIEGLTASSANLMTGDSSTTKITMKEGLFLPKVNAAKFDSEHITWDTSGTDKSYGFIAGQLTTLPTDIIPDATDVFFRFWKNNGADPITTFTQWQGKLGSSLTSADAVSIDRATNGVMKLVFSEGDAVISPYQSIQILDTDSGTYRTYDIDTANPVISGKTASSNYVINNSVTTAITEDPDTSTDIAPGSGAGYDYTAGTGWQGSIVINSADDTIKVVNPETRGFTYNGALGVWEPDDIEIEVFSGGGTQTTDPTTVGYAYDSAANSGGGAWIATIEDVANVGSTTTTTPGSEGFSWNAASGSWLATVESGTTTVPASKGYAYTGGSWKATIENVNSVGNTITTTTPGAEGFSYNGSNWVASVEGGTTTVPTAEGYVYNSGSNNWQATVEDINNIGGTTTTTTPAAEGFSYTNGSWKATIENINNIGNTTTTTTPAAEGFTYTDGSWKATIEGGTTETPAAVGYTYNNSNWVATIEDVGNVGSTTTTTTPGSKGFTYNGSNWIASIEGGTTTTPTAEGYAYNNSNWVATIEDISNIGTTTTTTTPESEGFTYIGGNWKATIEDITNIGSTIKTTTPAEKGFNYNGTNWVATIEKGSTKTPTAEGYTYNSSSGFWQAEVETGVTTREPDAAGFSYNGTNWVAYVDGEYITNPTKGGYFYIGSSWRLPKINVGANSEIVDNITNTNAIEEFDQPDTALLNLEPGETEDSNGPSLFGNMQGLEGLVGDVDQDGTPDEAERITGIR